MLSATWTNITTGICLVKKKRCDSLIRDEWSDWDVGSPQIRTASYRCLFQVLLNAAKQEYKEDLSMVFLEAGECTLPFTLRLSRWYHIKSQCISMWVFVLIHFRSH